MRKSFKNILVIVFCLGIVTTIGTGTIICQELFHFQLIDSNTENGIPYAYIKVIGKNVLEVSDQDGFFVLPDLGNDSIQISHIAYKPILTSFDQIRKRKKIKMVELAIETNPIVISAKSAKSFAKRAIDSTYKALYDPMYITCFRKDQLIFRDSLVKEVKAEIIFHFKEFGYASFGAFYQGYLKNIIVRNVVGLNNQKVPHYQIPASFAPFNKYFVGTTPRYEKFMYFSNQEANDSIIIIGMSPKQSFIPQKFLLKNIRFIINKNSWKLIRMDATLSPSMMEAGRSNKEKLKDESRHYYYYSMSYFFDNSGILSKILLRIHFSIGEDNPEKIWQNISEIVYVNEKINPGFDGLLQLKKDTMLIQMESNNRDDFEKRFDRYIP